MYFQSIKSEGLAQLSYFLADESTHQAVVIDPRRDVDVYLQLARNHDCAIRAVFETHIHADFACGSRELADATGARIFTGPDSNERFDHHALAHGDVLEFGSLKLKILHTPGHSPEHICLLAHLKDEHPDHPWALFTGDTLFAGSVGRPDLAADHSPEELAEALHTSLFDTLGDIDDGVIIYPGHGSGSACGADIGDRDVSSMGYERNTNEMLQLKEKDAFRKKLLDQQPEAPPFYERLKKANTDGFAPSEKRCAPRPLPTTAFKQFAQRRGTRVIDVRSLHAFHGAHIPGSIHIGFDSSFDNWAGWILHPGEQILLVTDDGPTAQEVTTRLFRLGLDDVTGFLAGGLDAWINAGEAFDAIPLASQYASHGQNESVPARRLLDVRTDEEWNAAKIEGAIHLSLPDIIAGKDDITRDVFYTTYCGSGYRASIAASLLKRRGFKRLQTMAGSMKAWTAAELPTSSD